MIHPAAACRASPARLLARAVTLGIAAALSACSGGLRSDVPSMQAWALDPPPALAGTVRGAAAATAPPRAAPATLRVLRPIAAPALDTDRIALRRGDRTLDYYAGNRWSARVPELVQGLLLDTLRDAGDYRAVLPEAAPFTYEETLQVEVRDFHVDYATAAAPVARVTLVCTLGRRGDRAVLAAFTLAGSAAASDNRMRAIVAAFNAALDAALAGLPQRLAAGR